MATLEPKAKSCRYAIPAGFSEGIWRWCLAMYEKYEHLFQPEVEVVVKKLGIEGLEVEPCPIFSCRRGQIYCTVRSVGLDGKRRSKANEMFRRKIAHGLLLTEEWRYDPDGCAALPEELIEHATSLNSTVTKLLESYAAVPAPIREDVRGGLRKPRRRTRRSTKV